VEIVVAVSGLCYLCCDLGVFYKRSALFLLRRICTSLFLYEACPVSKDISHVGR
jgi:hypothetical protein